MRRAGGTVARAALALAAMLATLAIRDARAASAGPPRSWREADALAASPSGRDRDRLLQRWAERAALPEILYLLRRPARELGGAEGMLAEAALRQVPPTRRPLRLRLLLRLAAADATRGRRYLDELTRAAGELPRAPRASVFRMGVLLPDSGDYSDYARSLRAGLEVGLARSAAILPFPVEVRAFGTGQDQPERAIAAFDSAADCGVLVGELLSVPTFALAAAAHASGLPLVSPTASDEAVGAITPTVFQVGPSGYWRGEVLAESLLAAGPQRVGVLTSTSVAAGSFTAGFAAAAARLGSAPVWRERYLSGTSDFRAAVRLIKAQGLEVLFWDGEAREGESLVRQLARDGVSLRLCGGEALSPDRAHAEARMLLEGVRFVGEDLELDPVARAAIDSTQRARGAAHGGAIEARGYLTGRLVAATLAEGALCPEEAVVRMGMRTAGDPFLRSHGFIDWRGEARLPVYTVRNGRATE